MTHIFIGLLVVLIVMVQVLYLERYKAYRQQLLVLFTVIVSIGMFFALRDPVASFASSLKHSPVSALVQGKPIKPTMKEFDGWYVEAYLAYEAGDRKLALLYFNLLYDLKPSDHSYYREYADTLLSLDPENPHLAPVMAALAEQTERDPGWLLLFARYEQWLGNIDTSQRYYEEAMAKLK